MTDSARQPANTGVAGPTRIRPGTLREVGPVAWTLARAGGRLAHTQPMNLFLVLGRQRGLFLGWLHFAARLMPFGRLPRRDSELVILRVAHLRSSAYEFGQHERIGRRAGLSTDDIARVRRGSAAPGWTDRQRVLLDAVDELIHDRDLGDDTWTRLRRHVDERAAVELVLLAGHYDMVAAAIAALRIEREAPRH